MIKKTDTCSIEKILSENGPLPASKVKEFLLSYGLSDDAARQRMSRSRQNIKNLSLLPKKEKFLYLEAQYDTDGYWSALLKALLDTNSSYGIAFYSILARGNAVPSRYFDIISGSPKKLSKHLSSSSVLDKLKNYHFLRESEINKDGTNIAILEIKAGNTFSVNLQSIKTDLFVEDIIINAVSDWLKKIGFVSFNKVEIRNIEKTPEFCQFGWDITAPSYIYPLVQKNTDKPNPGFVVVDVVNKELDKNHIKYFINKCRISRQLNNTRPFFAILVAEHFTKEAFDIGKKEGLLFTTTKILFGEDVANALKELTSILKNAAAVAASNPEKLDSLLEKTTKIEGRAINLRGPLFELIVGHLVYNGENGYIEISVDVAAPDGKKAEIDVMLVKGKHEVALYECKGYSPTTIVSKEEIEKWLKERIPTIRKALLQETRFKSVKTMIFEYWTTGVFSDETTKLLEEAANNTKKYTIKWKSGKEVREYAQEKQLTCITKILNEHYR